MNNFACVRLRLFSYVSFSVRGLAGVGLVVHSLDNYRACAVRRTGLSEQYVTTLDRVMSIFFNDVSV